MQIVREHIRLEEKVLLPQADRLLSPEEQEALAAELERIEAEALGPDGRAHLDRSAEALCNEVLGA